jgi:GTP-binding protein
LEKSSKKRASIDRPILAAGMPVMNGDDELPRQKKSSSTSPPWQVLGTKDAKRNVEKELTRRNELKDLQNSADFTTARTSMDHARNFEQDEPRVLSTVFLDSNKKRLLNWKRFQPTKVPAGIRYIGSYLGKDETVPTTGVPEIAFLGRSNVGKSSLLNQLSKHVFSSVVSAKQNGSDAPNKSGQNTLARVGKTPGATSSVNLYTLVDVKSRPLLSWVDLPGFGYAQLSKERQALVQDAAERYLSNRVDELALGILLVDIRRTPSVDDQAVLAALYDLQVPILVVATKVDKIVGTLPATAQLQAPSSTAKKSGALYPEKVQERLEEIREGFGLSSDQPLLCISSTTGYGTRDLWRIILDACETKTRELRGAYDHEAAKELAELDSEADADSEEGD